MRNCYNTGMVSYTGTDDKFYIGGIAGYSYSSIIYCYTSEESSEMNFGSMTGLEEGNKAYPASYMQTTEFLNMLNADLSYCDEWIPWEIRSESPYPLPMKLTNITACNIALSKTACVYTGKAQKPGVSITYNGKTLKQDVDYTVEYENNVNVGTATITIAGKGIYQGSTSLTFQIQKAEQTFTYTKSYKKAYNSKAFSLNAKLQNGNGTLSYKSSNSTVASVSKSGKVTVKKIGTAVITVKASGTDNYNASSIQISITVAPKKLSIQKAVRSKNKLNITWTKDSKVKGYELQYATDKKFKNNLKSVKIKKAKVSYKSKKVKSGKTYYVRVRAYKGNIYGAWSKTVVVKK